MKRLFAVGLLLFLPQGETAAQEIAPPRASLLQDVAVSDSPNAHALTLQVEWASGSGVPLHTHPGDEYAVVTEGELTLTSKDKPDRVISTGQAYHNPRGLEHEVRSTGRTAARTIAVFVIDKGAPVVQPVR